MKNFFLVIVAVGLLVGCSTPQKRTRFSDKSMRVMIDPASISAEHHVRIQKALVASGRFAVIDRGSGMNAIKLEQERLHRIENDRYEDREKWAHWGKLYGVGAIIVAHTQCYNKQSFWNPQQVVRRCDQFLTMVDSNTAEVIVAVEGQADIEAGVQYGYQLAPNWDETVEKLVNEYPKNFEFKPYTKSLVEYQDLSEEQARRQRAVASEGK